jgi:hypothetical protein
MQLGRASSPAIALIERVRQRRKTSGTCVDNALAGAVVKCN